MAGNSTPKKVNNKSNSFLHRLTGVNLLEESMEKFLIPIDSSSQNPTPHTPFPRHQWQRGLLELNAKLSPKYRHDIYPLLMQSYSQVGAFPHSYHINGAICRTHVNMFADAGYGLSRQGITALEFDSKGIYIASVTKSGCLTVHDFDVLFSGYPRNIISMTEDEGKQLLHISVSQQLDVVRWNLANQDEVACTSTKSSEVQIFDIGYVSAEPVEVLRKKPTVTINGCNVLKGLSDIAFPSNDSSRLFASDVHGAINMWDRRVNHLPCLELTSSSSNALSSITLHRDNQVIFGASKNGTVYTWDLRGGRSSAFQYNKEAFNSPMMSMKLTSQLEKIEHLKAQSNIVSKEVHSIDINPSCPNQLAFHLDDGWSGVLDLGKWKVTHIHCPPPAWLDDVSDMPSVSCLRKPSWLPRDSIYAVGSSSSNGLYLLDFYMDSSSPCHVDYDEHIQEISKIKRPSKQNSFVPLQEGVTACTVHPVNGAIVAGTKLSSLLVVYQKSGSCGNEYEGTSTTEGLSSSMG